MPSLILYGTAGCHLCEEAEHLLRLYLSTEPVASCWADWVHVDIAEQAVLLEQYGTRIPVFGRQDTQTELGWPFTLGELQMFLQPKSVCF